MPARTSPRPSPRCAPRSRLPEPGRRAARGKGRRRLAGDTTRAEDHHTALSRKKIHPRFRGGPCRRRSLCRASVPRRSLANIRISPRTYFERWPLDRAGIGEDDVTPTPIRRAPPRLRCSMKIPHGAVFTALCRAEPACGSPRRKHLASHGAAPRPRSPRIRQVHVGQGRSPDPGRARRSFALRPGGCHNVSRRAKA